MVAVLAMAPAASAATLTSVPLEARSNVQEVAVDANGNAWITGPSTNAVYRVTPDRQVTKVGLGAPNGAPQGVALGADGLIYVCLPTTRELAPVEPPDGTLRPRIPLGGSGNGCWDLADGPPGSNRLYFSGRSSNDVGYVDLATGAVKRSGSLPGRPVGITTGPDGRVWTTIYDGDAVARLDPSLDPTVPGAVTTFPLPGDTTAGRDLGPRDITTGPDGNLWVTEEDGDRIVRLSVLGGITEFPLGEGSRPNRVHVGPDGHLWFSAGGDRLGRLTTGGALAFYPFPPRSLPRGLTTGSDGALRIAGEQSGVLFRLPVDLAPLIANVRAGGALGGTVTVSADVDARGIPTTLVVDHGNSPAYGSVFGPVSAGVADGPVAQTATLRDLAPGTHHVRLRAANAFGERAGPDVTVVVPAPPPEAPPDRDGDGIPDGTDCAPDDPARSQLAQEVAGNDVDEDCDGVPAPFPKIAASFDLQFDRNRGVRFTGFKVTSLPPGGTVQVRCKPPRRKRTACPFRRLRRTYPGGVRSASLLGRFERKRLRPGTVLDLRALAPEQLGLVWRFRVTSDGLRRVVNACVRPGERRPIECPPAGGA